MKLEQKGFIFSDLNTVLFATPGLVRAISFKIPPPGGISYKARKRSACRTLAPSAVAIATISSRASVHPPEGFLLYRNCVVIAQQVRDSTVNGNKQFPIKQKDTHRSGVFSDTFYV